MASYTVSLSLDVLKGLHASYRKLIKFDDIDSYKVRDVVSLVNVFKYSGFEKLTIQKASDLHIALDFLGREKIYSYGFFNTIKRHIDIVEKYRNKNMYNTSDNSLSVEFTILDDAERFLDTLSKKQIILNDLFSEKELHELIKSEQEFFYKHKKLQMKEDEKKALNSSLSQL